MKKYYCNIPSFISLLIIILFSSCTAKDKSDSGKFIPRLTFDVPSTDMQIAQYIRHIYQDKNGHFWFGTNNYGVAHYDGDSLSYYSNVQGFHGGQITGITEDSEKNIWFSTNQGIVKYEWKKTKKGQKAFTNFSDKKLFSGKHFWSVFVDSKDHVWAGTGSTLYRYDGHKWGDFKVSLMDLNANEGLLSDVATWSVIEDRNDNLWFGTSGNGALKYDGSTYTQYTTKDGLPDDSVDQIMEDSQGNLWFGTRFGGVSMYNGKVFKNFTAPKDIGDNEVCIVYEDSKGNIWFSSEGYGIYRYDGKSLTNFFKEEGLMVQAVQAIYEDKMGRLWVGGGGGLYRLFGDTFINIYKDGPWK